MIKLKFATYLETEENKLCRNERGSDKLKHLKYFIAR